jgi:drug/metabolite transporter (DMT)-like permease
VVLSEPIPRAVWLGLPPSLVGLLLVLRPWDQLGGLDPGGVLAAVVSPLCIGAAGVMVRKLASGGRPEHAQVNMRNTQRERERGREKLTALQKLRIVTPGIWVGEKQTQTNT